VLGAARPGPLEAPFLVFATLVAAGLLGPRARALVGVALLAWELMAQSGAFHRLLVPSLGSIGRELWLLGSQPAALGEAWASVSRALAGFALAATVGVGVGVLMGRSPVAAGFFNPDFAGTYPVPKIALFPIFIFLFGIGSLSKVLLVFLECLYPIVITTYAGSRAVNRVLLWSALNMGASPGRVLWRVVVPAVAPHIFAGFRIALPIAMIVVIITEMISSADGLGYLVIYALASLKTDRMLALVVVIALLGLGLDRALVRLRDRLVFWERLESYYAA
jgi:ABC-type nitrate/sulfonate/bicarbonate transport system permease component